MNLEILKQAVATGSVIRLVVDLSPLTSDGLVYPPTYAPTERNGPPHMDFRTAYVDGSLRKVVVLDSAQSQANRVEYAILHAKMSGRLQYPDINVTFPTDLAEPQYSTLQLSHRIFDATLQCATLEGKPFFESDAGMKLRSSRPANATVLFELAPITLVLGAWDSHGGGGPMVAKLPRLLTSEIIGLDAEPVSISAMKVDQMDIRDVASLTKTDGHQSRRFEIQTKSGAKGASGNKPSNFGFGSVPSVDKPRAAVISSARQTSLLSCSGLRQLSFPGGIPQTAHERDMAARTVLAALALYGLLAQNESGYRLRSRCELVPLTAARLEVIGRTLDDVKTFSMASDDALQMLDEARTEAAAFGLRWATDDIALKADDRLTELVRLSRKASGSSDNADE